MSKQKELLKGKMYMTSWVKVQLSNLEELILSIERKVNKIQGKHETTKKRHAKKMETLHKDLDDVKTSVNIILEGLKK